MDNNDDFEARIFNMVGKKEIRNWKRNKIRKGKKTTEIDTISEVVIKTFLEDEDDCE